MDVLELIHEWFLENQRYCEGNDIVIDKSSLSCGLIFIHNIANVFHHDNTIEVFGRPIYNKSFDNHIALDIRDPEFFIKFQDFLEMCASTEVIKV